MPENDLFRRYLDAGIAFTQLTRQRAESIVKDLVSAGEVSREQAATRVEELLERSRQNTEAILSLVRKEIDERMAQLNLVSRDDLAGLVSRLGGGRRRPAARRAKAATPAKKAPAKKAPARKAPAKKAPARKAPAKKAPAKKAPAKKAGA